MIPKDMRAMLLDYLFSFDGHHVYIVADGAALDGLQEAIAMNKPEYSCLYNSSINAELAAVAPYLIKVEKNSALLDWLLDHWGKFFGIAAIVPGNLSLDQVRQHFHNLLQVKHPEGRAIYFRFYDPRVLRQFLPMSTAEQIPMMFGPIKLFVMEGETPTSVVRFWAEVDKVASKESKFEAAA